MLDLHHDAAVGLPTTCGLTGSGPQVTGTRFEEPGVLTELSFLDRHIGRVVRYAYPGVTTVENFSVRARPVFVGDARASRVDFSLAEHGFCLRVRPMSFRDFRSSDGIRRDYFREVEALVRAELQTDDVIAFSCAMLSSRPETSDLPGANGPAFLAHNDYTAEAVPIRLREILGASQARRWLRRRVVQVNVWRPIGKAVEEAPLAFCDARTTSWHQSVAAEYRHRDRASELCFLKYDSRQIWWYFPKVSPQEVILFKGYDSHPGTGGGFVPHAAFKHAEVAVPSVRESVSVRVFACIPHKRPISL